MLLALYALISLSSFILLGTLVPSLVSAMDSTMVISGFLVGAVLFASFVYCVYQILVICVKAFDEGDKNTTTKK